MAVKSGQKAERVLSLLLGMRNKRVAAAMGAYGFNNDELDEGWRLLRATGRVKFSRESVGGVVDTGLLGELDAWENRWFPIAKLALDRKHPAVGAQVFKNLMQQEGAAVTVSVSTFLERYDAMAAGEGAYGAEGAPAKAVLAQRGLNDTEIAKARSLLQRIGTIDDTPVTAEDPAELEEAETQLWKWYLEWSQIARTAITQKSLLKGMGFGKSRTGGTVTEEEEEEPAEPANPVVGPAPVPPVPQPV